MKNPEKFSDSFIRTVFRTVLTAAVIALIIFLLHVFPSGGRSKLSQFEMLWLMVFTIVFGGHWLEFLFINYIKFALPSNLLLLCLLRIIYWFLCAIPLLFIAKFIEGLFSDRVSSTANWCVFGVIYIGIELFMHAIMQLRFKKSFYNGVY